MGRLRTTAGRIIDSLLGRPCPVCGAKTVGRRIAPVEPELYRQWGLDSHWAASHNKTERTICSRCRCSLRSQMLARALVTTYAKQEEPFEALCQQPAFQAMRIAELNSAGGLHRFLSKLPNVTYTEYGSTDPAVPHEDLMALSYPERSFDLVITSETLEHLPDIDRGLDELFRIMRPGAYHIFTTPVIFDGRKTRQRTRIEDGEVVHLLPPSYHGPPGDKKQDRLVFYEFGEDFPDLVRSHGFDVTMVRHPSNPTALAFITRKL